MRKIKTANHTIDIVLILVLFCLFAASVLSVLLAGANGYQGIVDKMEGQYAERTCLYYLDAKIRHYDETGMVDVESFVGTDALVLYETFEETRYKTLIYYADGYVRELFFEDGLQFQPEDGQKIIPAQDLQVTRQKEDLLKLVCIGEDGRQEQLLIGLRSGKGVDWYEAAE